MKNSCRRPDCVITAAGLSSRMGQWKMLLPFPAIDNQQPTKCILDVSIDNALSFCGRIILVVGHRHQELIERYQNRENIHIVVNQAYQRGMFSSMQAGAKQVTTEHFFIVHGDMPLITHDIYQRMWANRSQNFLFPGTKADTGHPVLLPLAARTLMIQGKAEDKMKSLLAPLGFRWLNLGDWRVNFDVDTPDAYQMLCQFVLDKQAQVI